MGAEEVLDDEDMEAFEDPDLMSHPRIEDSDRAFEEAITGEDPGNVMTDLSDREKDPNAAAFREVLRSRGDNPKQTFATKSKLGIQRISKKNNKSMQKTSNTTQKKVVMAQSADELAFGGDVIRIPNHAYLEAAKKVGDFENLNRAKQIRSEFRQSLLRKAEALEKDRMIKQAKQVKKIETVVATKEEKLVPKNEYSETARTLIANRLVELGIPETTATMYVQSVHNPKNKEVMENIIKIASLNTENKVKKNMIKAFVKESQNKLDPDNVQRIKEYWKNELGYQDTKWIDDLVKDIDPVTGA
jgi:hypothetical protein